MGSAVSGRVDHLIQGSHTPSYAGKRGPAYGWWAWGPVRCSLPMDPSTCVASLRGSVDRAGP